LLSRPTLLRFVLVMFLVIAAQALMETTFGLWADVELQWGPREVGWTLAALGAGAVLACKAAARALRRARLGERMTLLIGLALFAAGFAGLAVSHEVATMAASLTALGDRHRSRDTGAQRADRCASRGAVSAAPLWAYRNRRQPWDASPGRSAPAHCLINLAPARRFRWRQC
jgi:MFS family permease